MEPLARRILVIDDDPDFAYLVRTLLRRVVTEVAVETSAPAGLAAARAHRPDLILCDVDMPKMTGFELRRQLVATESLASVPFVFISRRHGAADQLQGLRLGAADYLAKPIDHDALLARVIYLLARSTGPSVDDPEPDRRGAAGGRLSLMPLADLVQMVEAGHTSGTLVIQGPQVSGRLSFRDGQVVAAEAGEHLDEDAALLLLGVTDGDFRLERAPIEPTGKSMRVGGLLMDAAWIQDELAQLGDAAPRADDAIRVEDPAAARTLFPDSEPWRTFVDDRTRKPERVSRLAEALGIGTLRARVLLGQAVKRGVLEIV